MTSEAQVLETRDEQPVDGQGRRIFSGVEHGEIELPAHLLFAGGDLEVYESIASRNLFRVYAKSGRLVVQAGKAIGLIPLNDRVALEVRSRVPIRNLERLLCLADSYEPHVLTFQRSYGESTDVPDSILDVMADALLDAVDSLREEGHFKTYNRVMAKGAPAGRILPLQSALAQIKSGAPVAVFARFERTVFNAVNRHIKAALFTLSDIYLGIRERVGTRKRIGRLARALQAFSDIPRREAVPQFGDLFVREPDRLPSFRPQLGQAVRLSSLLLQSTGLTIRGASGPVSAPSILISMEDVFERYVRQFSRAHSGHIPNLQVLDGNVPPPQGGAGVLFTKPHSAFGNPKSTPDTMFVRDGAVRAIIETKYKPCRGLPERDELNQAITYGLSFECPHVILTYPAYDGSVGIEPLGEVGSVKVYKATVSLGAPNLEEAEAEFSKHLLPLL